MPKLRHRQGEHSEEPARTAEVPSHAVHADADLLHRIAEGKQPIESWVPIALDVPCLVVDTTRGGFDHELWFWLNFRDMVTVSHPKSGG